MTPVVSRAQARAFDSALIARGVPSLVLMENAGRNAADVLERELLGGTARGKRVVVFAGTGNNGGDGLVVARHLLARGARVGVTLVGEAASLSPDARANADAWRAVGGEWLATPSVVEADAVVDALFGTGLQRPLEGAARAAVQAMEGAPVMAVDIPSGLDADTGQVLGVAVHATHTVTFVHPKLGLLTPNGAEHAGRLHVVDIGVPDVLAEPPAAELITPADVAALVKPRSPRAHKYTAGHVGVLAGSLGKTGAALLVSRGALRAGAGAVTIATWHDALESLQGRVLEVMTAPLDVVEKPLIDVVASFAQSKRAVVAGPGFGLDERAATAVRTLLVGYEGPVVLDADALTLHAGRLAELARARAKLVLTPHAGEAARLLGVTSEAVEADRFGAVRELARKAQAVAVLKGAHTLIADPAGRTVVSPVANPLLATAGSGDVLAGIVGACVGELSPFDAACAGVMLHGLAAERWTGERGMLASEIAEAVPAVLASLRRASRDR